MTTPTNLRRNAPQYGVDSDNDQAFLRRGETGATYDPVGWPRVAVSASKTLSDADHMTLQVVSANATLTVPAGLRADFWCKMFYTAGSGQILVAASSTTIRTLTTLEVSTQYGEADLIAYGTDTYYIKGDLDAS